MNKRTKNRMQMIALVFFVSFHVSAEETYTGEFKTEWVGEYIEEHEKRRGYTNEEYLRMYIKVSSEKKTELVFDLLVEGLNGAYKNAVNAGAVSTSIKDRDAVLASFVDTAGRCTMLHAAQRDRQSDSLLASFYEDKRAKMAELFLGFLTAFEKITGYSNIKDEQIKALNTGYEENIKVWLRLVDESNIEGSSELENYNQWNKKCDRLAEDYDKVLKQAKDKLDRDIVEAETIKRLTSK